MKESLSSTWKAPIFRETFSNAFSVAKNGGSATSLSFSNGVATLNGSSSYVKYTKPFNGVFSVRVRLTALTPTSSFTLIDFRNNTASGTGYITGGLVSLGPSSGTTYVNGIATTTISSLTKEIVVTGISISCFEMFLGARYNLINFLNASVELLEIYDYTLTANEVLNLYENKRYINPLITSEVLRVDSRRGSITNRWNTSLTNTAVSVVKAGQIYVSNFNGTSSKLDLGSYNSLIGDKTFVGWVFLNGFGTSEIGGIMGNDKFRVSTRGSGNNRLYFYSDGSTFAASATGSLVLGRWIFLSITRTATGTANIYINGSLSGTADQSSGTPVAGTANITLGIASGQYYNGLQSNIRVEDEILSAQKISQLFSSERKFYNV